VDYRARSGTRARARARVLLAGDPVVIGVEPGRVLTRVVLLEWKDRPRPDLVGTFDVGSARIDVMSAWGAELLADEGEEPWGVRFDFPGGLQMEVSWGPGFGGPG
jgi:hypothetical protein